MHFTDGNSRFEPQRLTVVANAAGVYELPRVPTGTFTLRAYATDGTAAAEPYTRLGLRTVELTPWQRNEGTLTLRLRFADGFLDVDNRTYSLQPPSK